MRSALYIGTVRHRRFSPVRHEFTYRVAMPLVDLDELAPGGPLAALLGRVPRWLCRFERSDYLGDPAQPLGEAVRDLVAARSGLRPLGTVRLLTNLRTAGYNFNPLSVYLCDGSAGLPEAFAFEVTNTPWGERGAYVAVPPKPGALRNVALAKSLHVSPFLPMDLEYRFSCSLPAERLDVRFELRRDGLTVFDADLWTKRRSLDEGGLWTLLARYPLMPQRMVAGIYLQAGRLRLRGAPFHRHPARAGVAAPGEEATAA